MCKTSRKYYMLELSFKAVQVMILSESKLILKINEYLRIKVNRVSELKLMLKCFCNSLIMINTTGLMKEFWQRLKCSIAKIYLI